MKRCPKCNRVETDNSLTFCRVDGTALIQELLNEDSGTVRFNSAPMSGDAPTSVLPLPGWAGTLMTETGLVRGWFG